MNGRIFIATLVVAVAIFVAAHFLEFRGSVPNFERASNGGVLLDMTPSFSEDRIYERLQAYGQRGREEYAFRNVTVDILLPLGLLPFLYLWMWRALRRVSLGAVPRALLLILPVLYVVFDLAENGSVLTLLANFPVRMHALSAVLPYLTLIKRAASMLAILVPPAIIVYSIARTRWNRLHARPSTLDRRGDRALPKD